MKKLILGNEFHSHLLLLILIALVVSIINALKPFHIDDTYYLWVARQILSEPFNPFGFEVFWQQWPMAAHEGYVPPLVPYWLALSLWVFGNDPFLLKLSMFPFVLLFVLATYLLARRFAPSVALPLTAFLAFSPAIVSSWNLMLDLPSIALGLMAIELLIQATERDTWKYALAAGSLAAMAILTKFSALTVPGVLFLYGILSGRILLSLGTGVFVLVLISAWEYFHYLQYGHTQLLWAVIQGSNSDGQLGNFSTLSVSALMTLGALCPLLISIYFTPGTINKSFLTTAVLTATLALAGYILGSVTGRIELLFAILGSALFTAIVLGLLKAIYSNPNRFNVSSESGLWGVFLLAWLALEAIAYFLISPFPAVRRLLILSILFTILGFRLLDDRITPATLKTGLVGCWILVVANMVISGIYFGVDFKEANAQKELVSQAADVIREADDGSPIWYVGHWGFAYYAEQAGMKPVVPESSMLKAGDWLVIPDRVHGQQLKVGRNLLAGIGSLEANDRIFVHTLPSFYSGQMPLRTKEGPTRLRVHLFRVRQDHIARTNWSLARIVEHINLFSKRESTLNAIPALLNFRKTPHSEVRRLVVETVASLNALAADTAPLIADMTTDQDPSVRVAVLKAFAKLGSRDPVVIAAIEDSIDDPVAEVRFAAQAALTELTEQNSL